MLKASALKPAALKPAALKPAALMILLIASSVDSAVAASMPFASSSGEPLSVRVNGVALEVRSMNVDTPIDNLADAILNAWRDSGRPGLRFTPDPERTVLGRQNGPIHETLTLLDTPDPRMTQVIHAVNDSRQIPAALPNPPFPLPRGLKIVRIIESKTGSEPVVSFSIETGLRALEVMSRLQAVMTESQWVLTSRFSGVVRSASMTAVRGTQELQVVATERPTKTSVTLEIIGRAP